MNQREAVIEVMKANNGYATLGQLYAEVWKIPKIEWKTKTPFASIRRIVQDEKFFFKIRPGLWALKDYKYRIPFDELSKKRSSQKERGEFNHTYFQALLVQIGNLKGFQTIIPNQDKNRRFGEKTLSELVTAKSFYPFTFEHILRRARTVDVVWFNKRKIPHSLFEVEHTSHIKDSLVKFIEMQDFNIEFKIVADESKRSEYQEKIAYEAFRPLLGKVKFINYQTIIDMHTEIHRIKALEQNW